MRGLWRVLRPRPEGALVQEMWQAKARVLNIPLSAKGHAVGQRGAFTGLAIDTHKGRFHMLPEKLASMVSARDDLAAAAVSAPRVIARVRGKALHYGRARGGKAQWRRSETSFPNRLAATRA